MKSNKILKAELFGNHMLDKEDRYSKVELKHIPILITDNNKIVCIPDYGETSHIGITGMCYDKETEVLTNEGFKKFSDLNQKELVAQVDPKTFKIEFVKPLSYTKKYHKHKMIHFKSKTIDLLVTPTHNMFVRNRRDSCINLNKWQFRPAKRLLKGDWWIPQACKGNKIENIDIPFPPSLLGIWMAEGSMYGINGTEIGQNEGWKLEKIKSLLNELGIKFKVIHSDKSNLNSARMIIGYKEYPQFARYVKQFGKAKDKFIPDWIKNSNFETIRSFLDWFNLGDGSIHLGRKRYHTSSKKLADDIQECLLRIGVTSSIYKYINNFDKEKNKIMYCVSERDTNYSCLWSGDNKKVIEKFSGYVYCVEVPTHLLVVRRNYRVALCGNTGKGKGIVGNSLLGFQYWMKNISCIILNDFQQETFEFSFASMNKLFNLNLKVINAYPAAYPIVYVYPNNCNIHIDKFAEKYFPHLKMTLPTQMIIKHIEKFYSMDKAAKYLTANIDEFVKCNDIQDVEEVLETILPKEPGKRDTFADMKYKIKTVFINIFNEEICSSSAPHCPAHLTIVKEDETYNNMTIQSLMYAGLIPSIQTVEIRSKPWFSAYMSFIVESIYEDKYNDELFLKNKPICMYVPEIDKMWKGDDGGYIKAALSLTGTNGRRAGIGMIWDAQDYDAVPDAIRSNTKHLIVLRKTNSEEVRGIKKDFNVDKEIEDKILSLITDPSKGKFEAVVLTSDRLILYDLRDGSMSITSEAQKGRLITPMAQHKAPGVKVEDLIR